MPMWHQPYDRMLTRALEHIQSSSHVKAIGADNRPGEGAWGIVWTTISTGEDVSWIEYLRCWKGAQCSAATSEATGVGTCDDSEPSASW